MSPSHPTGGFLFWDQSLGSVQFSFPTYRISKFGEVPLKQDTLFSLFGLFLVEVPKG